MNSLIAGEVSKYSQQLSLSDTDYQKKLEMLKAFLSGAKKEDWTTGNLSAQLKIKKPKARASNAFGKKKEMVTMTREGYEAIMNELESLKKQRPKIVEEIRRAAEDKDFRENAPLHAAKERLGHLEGRIMELEEASKTACIVDKKTAAAHRICTGDCVVLVDMSCGEEMRYTIVSPREVEPLKGRISNASPIGKAVIGKQKGDTIEIDVPAGKLRYRIELIEK